MVYFSNALRTELEGFHSENSFRPIESSDTFIDSFSISYFMFYDLCVVRVSDKEEIKYFYIKFNAKGKISRCKELSKNYHFEVPIMKLYYKMMLSLDRVDFRNLSFKGLPGRNFFFKSKSLFPFLRETLISLLKEKQMLFTFNNCFTYTNYVVTTHDFTSENGFLLNRRFIKTSNPVYSVKAFPYNEDTFIFYDLQTQECPIFEDRIFVLYLDEKKRTQVKMINLLTPEKYSENEDIKSIVKFFEYAKISQKFYDSVNSKSMN